MIDGKHILGCLVSFFICIVLGSYSNSELLINLCDSVLLELQFFCFSLLVTVCLTTNCVKLYYVCVGFFLPRLLQMLERDSDHGRSEPFRTYDALDQAARSLNTNVQLTRDSVAGASREQHYMAARLYSDCEALHRAAYTELQQLVLGPQVRLTATTDQDLLCPSAQVGLFLFTSLGQPTLHPALNVSLFILQSFVTLS